MRIATVPAALLLAFAAVGRADAAAETDVKPGPTVMSAEEKAIVANVAGGAQHGVILIDETDSNDDRGAMSQTAYHLRAKILSQEGRGLADITIPVDRGPTDLRRWWGRTIFPDGRVIDLPESALKMQSVAKSAAGEMQEYKGALPGVVPGCVIDYGWIVERDGFYRTTRVVLQREWPVRSFRYRWSPNRYEPAAYTLSRAGGLAIDVKRDGRAVLVTARDLDPVPGEPHMPPLDEARATATFYYSTKDNADEYWDHVAKRIDAELKQFLGSNAAVRDTLEILAIPEGVPLGDKLRIAYDWLGANVTNTTLLSAEEEEAHDDRGGDSINAKQVLKAKEASPQQLDFLFAGMARALGADARIVLAVDRTGHFWNKPLKSIGQFTFTFVAVRSPGAQDDTLVFVDAGSGLPYGQVPWRATGVQALICGATGSSSAVIPPASPKVNRTDAHVTLAFTDDNQALLVTWARTAQGAAGLEYRRWLRDLDARKRKETLDALCGSSARTEVTAAELPELDKPSAPFQIKCGLEQSEMNIGSDIATYSLALTGPWSPEIPQFPSPTRVHPVIFDFPRADIVAFDVSAPHGFKPKDPPAAVALESQYGKYHLVVTATPTGFHVDRAFAMTVLLAKPDEYGALRKFFDDVRKADAVAVTFERDGAGR